MRQGPDGLVEVGGLAVALLLLAAPEVDPAAPGRKDMVNKLTILWLLIEDRLHYYL